MRKIISFMHISLDGFVAGPKGEMNWIKVDEELFDFVGKRISKGDAAMYGRVTYQMMENYWPTAGDQPDASKHDMEHSKWYKGIQKIVLSKTLKESGRTDLKIISDNLAADIIELKKSPQGEGKEILLFGSPSATHSLLQLNLIDGFWLFVNPIVLGKGIPLFTGIQDRMQLKLVSTTSFSSGVTELNYLAESKDF